MQLHGTKAEILDALYECNTSVTALAAQIGVHQSSVYKTTRLWCVGGTARHQTPRGRQVRRIIKELNRHIHQAHAGDLRAGKSVPGNR